MQIKNKGFRIMKLEEQLEMIDEENCCINDNVLRIYYILKHLIYNEPKPKEFFVLGKFLLVGT